MPNQEYFNATLIESIAKFSRLSLSNIEEINKLGMDEEWINSISNYIVFFIFVILVPILFINLLIGVSTGELRDIMNASNVIQYQLRLKTILGWQDYLINRCGFKVLKKHFFFKTTTVFKNSKSKQNENKSKEKSDEMLKKMLEKMEDQHQNLKEQLIEKFSLKNKEIELKLTNQMDKIQMMQDGQLENINQNEQLIQSKLKENEEKILLSKLTRLQQI